MSTTGTLNNRQRSRVVENKIKTTRDTCTCHVTDLVCFPSGRLIVADHANSKVKLFDYPFSFVSEVKMKSRPWAITIMSTMESQKYALNRNQTLRHGFNPWPGSLQASKTGAVSLRDIASSEHVAVTLPTARTIQFVSIAFRHLVTRRTIQTESMCYGIARFQNRLIVGSECPSMIQILDGSGRVLSTIKPDGCPFIASPRYIVINEREPGYFVSDCTKNCVYRLAGYGKELFKYKECGMLGGLTPHASGYVSFADSKSKAVFTLTADGNVSKKRVVGPEAPSSVTVSHVDMTMIVVYENSDYLRKIPLTREMQS